MFDPINIKFNEVGDEKDPSVRHVFATIEFTHEAIVRDGESVEMHDVHDTLRTCILYKIFGDLKPAVRILLLHSDLPELDRTREIAVKFLNMFNPTK